MIGAFHCPHCGTVNACACETCAPHIKEGEYVNKWKQERSYSEEDLKNAFFEGWIARDGDLPFPKAKKKWFNEFKKQLR